MSRIFAVPLTLCIAAAIGGCATSYQKEGWFTGGFSETQLAPNVWAVNFRGNGYTSDTRAEELVLLRSADIALANGFTHFALVDSRLSSTTHAVTQPTTSVTSLSGTQSRGSFTGSATTTNYGGGVTFITKPSARNTVMMFKEAPAGQGLSFDAKFVCASLGTKYKVACQALGTQSKSL